MVFMLEAVPEIEIHPATLADVDLIVQMTFSAMGKHLEMAFGGGFDWGGWETDIRGVILRNKREEGIIETFITKQKKIVGFWWITPHLDHLWIDAIVLNENHRNGGIGSWLLKNFDQIFSDLYPANKNIQLGVQKTNQAAVRFYERLGFQEIPDEFMELHNTLHLVKK